jgi:hypothetical protein
MATPTADANDTWVFNGQGWSQAEATVLEANSIQAMTYDAAHALSLAVTQEPAPDFNSTGHTTTETWTSNGGEWQHVDVAHRPAAGRSLVYDTAHNVPLLFTPGAPEGNAWVWRGSDWSAVSAAVPSGMAGRLDTQVAWDSVKQRALFYGGRTTAPAADYSDVWDFALDASLASGTWTQRTVSGSAPVSSGSQAATYDAGRGRFVLVQTQPGPSTPAPPHGMWELDSAGAAWTQVSPPGLPAQLFTPGMGYDPEHRSIFLRGRVPNSDPSTDVTWRFDGSTWTQLDASGGTLSYNDLMAYDSARHRMVLAPWCCSGPSILFGADGPPPPAPAPDPTGPPAGSSTPGTVTVSPVGSSDPTASAGTPGVAGSSPATARQNPGDGGRSADGASSPGAEAVALAPSPGASGSPGASTASTAGPGQSVKGGAGVQASRVANTTLPWIPLVGLGLLFALLAAGVFVAWRRAQAAPQP